MQFPRALARRIRRVLHLATFHPVLFLKATWSRERVHRHFAETASVGTRAIFNLEGTATTVQELDLDLDSVTRHVMRAMIDSGTSDTGTYVSSGAEGTLVLDDERMDEDKSFPPRRILEPPPSLRNRSILDFPVGEFDEATPLSSAIAETSLTPLSPPPSHFQRRRAMSMIESSDGEDGYEYDSACRDRLPPHDQHESLRFPF
ncbi:hypothetical protein OF83DRAFT_882978 [Amylostereum chailletii]|nr:hypothetical protein OF83DRAFT_882978 [Amylostereum chailletii]